MLIFIINLNWFNSVIKIPTVELSLVNVNFVFIWKQKLCPSLAISSNVLDPNQST